ncbi:MAG: DUF3108 domain-containing protein [Tahibacter sp.]
MRRLVPLALAVFAVPFSSGAVDINPDGIGSPIHYPPPTTIKKPFVAHYAVSRDGKALGVSTMTLRDEGHDIWSLTSETHGTAGMARLLGLEVVERSQFRWTADGMPEAQVYDYDQDAAIKSKKRHADFDWRAASAHVAEGKKSYDYPIPAGTMDRHTVGIALARKLAAGANALEVDVATKDHVEHQRFERAPETDSVQVPSGKYDAMRVERVDVPGKGRSWFVPQQLPVPVRVEQIQGDGATIVLELTSIADD